MGLFDFLKNKKKDKKTISKETGISDRLEFVTSIVEQIEKGTISRNDPYWNSSNVGLYPNDISGKEDLLFLSSLLPKLNRAKNLRNKIQIELITNLFRNYPISKSGITDEELYDLLYNWKQCKDSQTFQWSLDKLLNIVAKRITEKGKTAILKKTLLLFKTPESVYMFSDNKKVNQRIDFLLQEESSVRTDKTDEFGLVVVNYIDSIKEPNAKAAWVDLISYCIENSDKTAPPKNWITTTKSLLEKIDHKEFASKMIAWLAVNKDLLIAVHKREKGHLAVELNVEDEILYCKITDDGIGRKRAGELKSKSASLNKSMGMRITASRIAMLHQKNMNEVSISINDLVLANGDPGGTEVIIKIPLV